MKTPSPTLCTSHKYKLAFDEALPGVAQMEKDLTLGQLDALHTDTDLLLILLPLQNSIRPVRCLRFWWPGNEGTRFLSIGSIGSIADIFLLEHGHTGNFEQKISNEHWTDDRSPARFH